MAFNTFASGLSPTPTTAAPLTTAPTPTALTAPQLIDEIITVAQVATLLQCKPSSIYNLTRTSGATRYAHPLPVIRVPMGLRFLRSDVLAWVMKHRQAA